MKYKLIDLNNHLFAQLERLGDEAATIELIEQEVKRAGAMVQVAQQITANAVLQLKAAKLFADHGPQVLPMLPLVGGTKAEADR